MRMMSRIKAIEERLKGMLPREAPVVILPLDFPGLTDEQRQTAVDFHASGEVAAYGIHVGSSAARFKGAAT